MPNPNEEWQRLQGHTNSEPDSVTPDSPLQKWVSNLITRTWSKLYAAGTAGLVALGATDDGRLKVASTNGGFSHVEVINATGTAAYVEETFPITAGQVDFIVTGYALNIETSPDGITFGDAVEVAAGTTWSPPVAVKSFKIENSSGAGNGQLQAVGYY